jgi:3-mercaptopyruvate sulfurtransferase SseA
MKMQGVTDARALKGGWNLWKVEGNQVATGLK